MARRINECQVRTSRSELWASTTTTSPIKGVLIKRSKSFGTNNNNNSNKSGHGHRNYFSTNALLLSEPENDRFVLSLEGLSWNNMSLIKQALDAHHCSSLSTTDQLQVVRILTNKVLDKSGHARLVALVCLEMHYKLIGSCSPHVGGRVFLESLYHCLQEYFNERDVLRFTTGGARRWTAYITFLVSIYTSLCRDFEQHSHIVAEYIRQHVLNDNWRPLATTAANNAAAAAAAALETGMQSEKHRRQFANLLLDTFQVILSNPSSTPAEIECMQCALHKCGELRFS